MVGSRVFTLLFTLVFAVWSIAFPVTVAAATYNAAGPFTGNTWLVPMQGTVFAGSRIGAFAAVTLGRLNPWVNAAALGLGVGKMVLELKDGSTASLRADHAPVPAPPGWTDNPAAPWSPIPPGTVPPLGTPESIPATPNPTSATLQSVCYKHGGYCSTTKAGAVAYCQAVDPGWCSDGSWYPLAENKDFQHLCTPAGGCAGYGLTYTYACSVGTVTATGTVPRTFTCVGAPSTYSCPSGQGYVLSGTNCTRQSCPAGYTWNGTACALSDQNQVKFPPDGEQDFKISNNQIVPDPRSSDPTTITPTDLQNPGYTIFNDPYGNPIMHGFTPLSDGGFRFDQSVQLTNNGQTQTTQNSMTLNGTGNITNINSTTYNGPITNTAGSPAVPTLQIPNDYNKEVTQQKILTGEGANAHPDFNADVTTKKESLDQELRTKAEAIPDQFNSDKGNWFSWVWTPPAGTCSPWVSTIHGQTVTWDLCPWIAKVRDTIGFLGAVAGAWMVYCELFRRDES